MRARRWLLAVLWVVGCGRSSSSDPESGEELLGGETTVFDATRDAFARPARNLTEARSADFFTGNSSFNRNWVTAPASTSDQDGLGPLFNTSACASCHFKDGRGRPPEGSEKPVSILFRLSIPGADAVGGPLADPTYGKQLSPQGVVGVTPEGDVQITRTLVEGRYPDGKPYQLEVPRYALVDLGYGPPAPGLMLSPRVAPAMIGLGLLEAVPESTILEKADPDDRDGDGISGRANQVWDAVSGTVRLGRFGWKANEATLLQQDADAFLGDIGITSTLLPTENCTEPQAACRSAPTGEGVQIDDRRMEQVHFYSRTLAVPARRDFEVNEVLEGKGLFTDLGCGACHLPKIQTGTLEGMPELSNQTIRPFTDLLLHDMGPDLQDGRPDFLATGSEWRTAPLWGIGLVATVNRHTRFMHDGRARSLEEAILWHGGEAEAVREKFKALDEADRAKLIRFVESL